MDFFSLKAFVPEEICLGKILKFFWGACREKKMGLSLKSDEKNKNCREKNFECRTLKDAGTKADTKSEEVDGYNTVFSDLIFTIAAAPD